jgi:hypothetical protein
MTRKWDEYFEGNNRFSKRHLDEFLMLQGQAFKFSGDQEINDFARWLGNSVVRRKKKCFAITMPEIVASLQNSNVPGFGRELIKTWVIPQLFDSELTHGDQEFEEPYRRRIADADSYDAIARLVTVEEVQFGAVANRAFLEAATLFVQGKMREAFVKYDEMRRAVLENDFIGWHLRGVLSLRSLDELERAVLDYHDTPARVINILQDMPFTTDLPIILVGMDPVYHERYARRLVKTAAGQVNLHFHICNPHDENLIKQDNVRYSFETFENAVPAYFATMRFLVLRRLLQIYRRPILTIDADSILDGQRPKIFDIEGEIDLMLGYFGGERVVMPWRFVNAQVVMAYPTVATEEFLRAFEAQFYVLLQQDGKVTWYVDQAVLTTTVLLNREKPNPAKVVFAKMAPLAGTIQRKIGA